MYRDIPAEMRALVEPILEDRGLELVDIEQRRGRAPWTVRVIVDTQAGDGAVGVDQCASVSREIATHLDAVDAIPERYNLEVTSPGLDRTLAREKDFVAACGQQVRVETRRPLDGRRRFKGTLLGFQGDVAQIDVDGEVLAVPFEEVARARTLYTFTREDFARRGQ